MAAGYRHTGVWAEAGKAYCCGAGNSGELGHGGQDHELVPRLIEGVLVGKRVVGVAAAAGGPHTVVWTDEGKAYSFGHGWFGRLGHGDEEDEWMPELIEGMLMGKRVV